jgi:hypothetical protein
MGDPKTLPLIIYQRPLRDSTQSLTFALLYKPSGPATPPHQKIKYREKNVPTRRAKGRHKLTVSDSTYKK